VKLQREVQSLGITILYIRARAIACVRACVCKYMYRVKAGNMKSVFKLTLLRYKYIFRLLLYAEFFRNMLAIMCK